MTTLRYNLDIAVLFLIIIVAILLRFESITQPFTDTYCWREASTAMMARNFFRGNWNILYPEVDWVGTRPFMFPGREYRTDDVLGCAFVQHHRTRGLGRKGHRSYRWGMERHCVVWFNGSYHRSKSRAVRSGDFSNSSRRNCNRSKFFTRRRYDIPSNHDVMAIGCISIF